MGLSTTAPLGPDRVFLGDIFAGDLGFFASCFAGATSFVCIFDLETVSLLFYLVSAASCISTSARVDLLEAILVGSGDRFCSFALFFFSIFRALSG
jgi:hypothetical protein